MLNNKGLTVTTIFEAESANYGESIGNITSLKKMSRSDGNMYTYISRQAMRYCIVGQMGIGNTPVSGEKGTVQFATTATILEYPEIDLFGYMKTRAKSKENNDAGGADTRSAVARLSNAIALEPYNSDLDFLTNMGLASRGEADGNPIQNNIAQSEIHHSLYSYTVSVDLDRVGIDGKLEVSAEEKAKRVCDLLDAIQFLYRDIKGRRENLAPLFVVGGVYKRKCPYFEGRCRLTKNKLDAELVRQVINSCDDTLENTLVGMLDGCFANSSDVANVLGTISVSEVFEALKKRVRAEYEA